MGTTAKRGLAAGIGLCALALAGCHKKPEGQVVASVNGEEITRRDLVTEFAAAGGRSADDLKAIQPALVQSIVNRKLLDQEAKRENLDKNPQYLALQQRGTEVLLAQLLAQSWNAKVKPASAGEAQAFVAANPLMFDARKALLVDEIDTASASLSDSQVAGLHSLDAVAAALNAGKKPFRRGGKVLDTLALPKDLAAKLVERTGGDPIAVRSGAVLAVIEVKQAKDTPVPPEQRIRVAQAALARTQAEQTTQNQIKQLRDTADISYLPGFGPTTGK